VVVHGEDSNQAKIGAHDFLALRNNLNPERSGVFS